MKAASHRLAQASIAVLLGGSVVVIGASQSSLEIAHTARALQPGEVVLLTIATDGTLRDPHAEAFDRDIALYAAGPDRWRGLVGLDLDVGAGRHDVDVAATASDGRRVRARYVLEVEPKEFPTRRLTVSEEYVNPPAAVIERIGRESSAVAAVFAAVTPERLFSGPFAAPVPGAPTSSFGKRSILNGQPRSPHGGTDFRAGEGTPVAAPNRGRVALSDDLYFSGHTVILDHGLGLYSYLAHLSRRTVAAGDLVDAGDLVGHVGATGRVTGPHLHWAVRLAGARVDPLSLMDALADAPGRTQP